MRRSGEARGVPKPYGDGTRGPHMHVSTGGHG